MARKKTISMNCLSQSSIQNAIKQLRAYQDSLTYKCQMVAQKLAEKGIEEMCADSWKWQSMNPNGYRD